MSWSVSLIGKPENVAAELESYGETLTGVSKDEYEAARPHLVGLTRQNFAVDGSGCIVPTLKFSAGGTGYTKDGVPQNRHCSVTIEPLYAKLV